MVASVSSLKLAPRLLFRALNEISHLVLLFFLFTSRGKIRYGGNPRDKIFQPRSRHSSPFRRPPSLLQCLGGRTGIIFCKRNTLETATPVNLTRCLGGRAGILSSQRRLLGLKTDHQFPTNHLYLGSLGWRRAARDQSQKVGNNVMLAFYYLCRKRARNNWKNIGRGIVTQFTKILHD